MSRDKELTGAHTRRRPLVDVDFGARTVSFTAKGGKRRVLPLNSEARAAVSELHACRPPSGHIFRNRSRYQLSTWGPFGQACREAVVEGLVFHDLQRTFSSRTQALAHPFTVRDLLGHSALQTTNAHYSPQVFESMREAVEALSRRPAEVVEMRAQS